MVDEEMQLVNAAIAQQEKQLSDAINKSAEYGQAGFDAALAYQTELRRLNEQLQAGMINEQTYAQAAGEARKQFDEQTKAIEARNKAAAEQAEEDRKAEQSQQRAVTKQTDAFFSATEQAAKFGEAGVAAARQYESGLVSLNQQLEDGRINEETYNREAEKLRKNYNKQIDAQEKANAVSEKIAGKQQELDAIQEQKAAALNGKSNEALKANDLRSSEGIAQFLALANGREDPAIEENRKQTKKLDEIRKEIAKLQAEKVEILGAAA